MKHLNTVEIPALSGKKLIKDSKLFSYIDPDFINYGASEVSKATKEIKVDVLELTEDSTFRQMFTNPEKMALTQEQILWFIENHKDKLNEDWYNFFLLKSKSNFFVACVYVDGDGSLNANVCRFGDAGVWDAEYRHRFFVPQLADTLTLEPSDTFIPDEIKKLKRFCELLTKD